MRVAEVWRWVSLTWMFDIPDNGHRHFSVKLKVESMPLPDPIFYPPFNITRASHICLKVADVARSRAFYETILGLVTTASDSRCAYLRGVEEACHHSLVLTEEAAAAACRYLGFRVLTDRELELAERWFAEASVSTQWMERPYQGHTLVVSNGAGFPAEFCASMEVQPRLFTDPAYSTAPARRLDHFQLLHPRVEEACEFYAKIGFRGSEYVEDADGLVGAFMYRKGNTHDLVFFSGEGPRLHHFAYTVADRSAILHACDLAGAAGYGANIERGPGRHGMDGAYYIYFAIPMVIEWSCSTVITRRSIPNWHRGAGGCRNRSSRGGYRGSGAGISKARILKALLASAPVKNVRKRLLKTISLIALK